MKTYYLMPENTDQKSFYKKAKVNELDNGTKELISYKTKVAMITKGGKFIRCWDGYSQTTKAHVNEFRMQNNLPPINKSEWDKLEIKGKSKAIKYLLIKYKGVNEIRTEIYELLQLQTLVNKIARDDYHYRLNWRFIKEELRSADVGDEFIYGDYKVVCQRGGKCT